MTVNATGSTEDITFELVNDKAELQEALIILSGDQLIDYGAYWQEPGLRSDVRSAIDTILVLVPRLMASYEQALELTYTLADAWESFMDNQTPAGLYVP